MNALPPRSIGGDRPRRFLPAEDAKRFVAEVRGGDPEAAAEQRPGPGARELAEALGDDGVDHPSRTGHEDVRPYVSESGDRGGSKLAQPTRKMEV